MATQIKSITELKCESREGGEFFILMNGYMKSSKWIQWDDDTQMFEVYNHIDETRQHLSAHQINSLDFSNIGLAIRSGSFFKEEFGTKESEDEEQENQDMEGETMEEKAKSKLVKKFQRGRLWLNVIEATDGAELFTINRSFKTNDGWVNSQFFQLEKGDGESIDELLAEYKTWKAAMRVTNAVQPERSEPQKPGFDDDGPVVESVVRFGEDIISLSG